MNYNITASKEIEGLSSAVDMLKILGMLFVIIGHLHWYFTLSFNNAHQIAIPVIRELGVNIFLFCSGFGLTIAFVNRSQTVTEYWKKRFLRVYPLYLVSLVLYKFFVAEISVENFLFHVFLAHNFVHEYCNDPRPLWFVGVVFQFYAIFPILFKVLVRNRYIFTGVVLSLYGVYLLISFSVYSHMTPEQRFDMSIDDMTLFGYAPILCFGMFCGWGIVNRVHNFIKKVLVTVSLLSIGVGVVVVVLLLGADGFMEVYELGKRTLPIFSGFFIIVLIFVYQRVVPYVFWRHVRTVAGGTFCAYLFHEFILQLISMVSSNYLFGLTFAVPSTLFIGYYLQAKYNNITN